MVDSEWAKDQEQDGEFASDFFSINLYKHSGDGSIRMVLDGADLGPDYLARKQHQLIDRQIIEAEDGMQPVSLRLSVFAFFDVAGNVWVDVPRLAETLQVKCRNQNGSSWYHARKERWMGLAHRFQLEDNALRSSIPYDRKRSPSAPPAAIAPMQEPRQASPIN